MTWWVLTESQPVATYNSLTLRAFTNVPDHLFVSYHYTKPARTPIYRTVRGREILCGFRYLWGMPHVSEQIQPGDTLYHRFNLTKLPRRADVWYFMWAPDGPFGKQIQGPLQHYVLPDPPYWPPKMYVATRAKGVFYTRTMRGPGEPHPVWIPLNAGLHSTAIWQLAWSLLAPAARLFVIAGALGARIIYRLAEFDPHWWVPLWSWLWPDWEPVLTNAEACTLTGAATGEICWIASNFNHPGHYYVLFNSALADVGTWCLKSTDYGDSWAAFQIYAGATNHEAGNIVAGISKGSSPYPPGSVLYATLTVGPLKNSALYVSTDIGETWAMADSVCDLGLRNVCIVDPTDCSYVYMTAFCPPVDWAEIYRSVNHGQNLIQKDGDLHLGHFINIFPGAIWSSPDMNRFVRALTGGHTYITWNWCTSWAGPYDLQYPIARMHIVPHSPDYLYLGSWTNAHDVPVPPTDHVLFVTDNEGDNMYGICGEHADQSDGGGDSIPHDCGGISLTGIMHPFPNEFEWWE